VNYPNRAIIQLVRNVVNQNIGSRAKCFGTSKSIFGRFGVYLIQAYSRYVFNRRYAIDCKPNRNSIVEAGHILAMDCDLLHYNARNLNHVSAHVAMQYTADFK